MIPAALYLSCRCEVLAVGRAKTIFQNDWFCTRISNFFQSPIFSIPRKGGHFDFLLTPMRGWVGVKPAKPGVFLIQSGMFLVVQKFIYSGVEI